MHKIVLASNNEYFATMLTGRFKEANEQEIVINEIAPNALELLIDYIYSSNITITENNVMVSFQNKIYGFYLTLQFK